MNKDLLPTELPDGLARDLEHIQAIEQDDQPTTVRKLLSRAILEWKLEHSANEYGTRKVSLARAAQDAGVSVWEMMEYVRSRKITAQYDREDLDHDIKEIYTRLSPLEKR